MNNVKLLLIAGASTPDSEIRNLIQDASASNTKVTCLILATVPAYPTTALAAMPYGGFEPAQEWVERLNATEKALRDRGEILRGLLKNEAVAGEVQPIQCTLEDAKLVVRQLANVSDFATVAPSLREDDPVLHHVVLEAVLFDSPISICLNGSPLTQPKKIFVAWNGERPAARALHSALPLLKEAQDVYVGVFDPVARESGDGEDPGSDVADWLSHHGCIVTVNQYPSGGEEIGSCIQRRAEELGADLVVMGAYGRSRMRQTLFGGTTSTMTKQTSVPILLAH